MSTSDTERFNFSQLYAERDRYFLDTIQKMLDTGEVTLGQLLSNPFAFIPRRELPQLLAYYELCKKIITIPGSVVEVGVYLGNGLMTWAKLLETFAPGNRGRKVYGFDDFDGYTRSVSEIDKPGIKHIQQRYGGKAGGFTVQESTVAQLIKLNNLDTLLPGVDRAVLYSGNLKDSFELFKKQEPGVRIAMLVVDVNLYIPTITALEELFDLIVIGGYIVLRGYGVKPWEGESKAVDEFIHAHHHEIAHDDTFAFSMYPGIVLKKEYQ